MRNINTDELEYAASISSDGLELYFTGAGGMIVGNLAVGARLRILVAKRDHTDEPFELPRVIDSIAGFVEAPTLTADGRILYYHQRDGERFHIYRVVKKKQKKCTAKKSPPSRRDRQLSAHGVRHCDQNCWVGCHLAP